MGDLQTLIGEYAHALSSYETAAAGACGGDLARVEHKLGGVHQRRGEYRARRRASLSPSTRSASGRRAARPHPHRH